jgi:osmotically inducible lipoprotein OsmB
MSTACCHGLRRVAIASFATAAVLGFSACGTTSGAVVGGVTGAVTVGTAPAVVGGAIVGGVVGHEIHKDRN